MANELMQREMIYQLIDGQEMRLTMGMVKKYLVQGRSEFVTEQELMYFMHECKARKMNPFLRECWLIKYSQKDKAQIVESIHHKRNRARKHSDCQGWEKGIIYQDKDGNLQESPHPFLPEGAILRGAYFEATPKGWAVPYRHEVSLAAIVKRKTDGTFTAFWVPDKQPSQLMKVAESQGLTALWGGEIGVTVIPEEIGEIETTESAENIGPEIYDGPLKVTGTDKQSTAGNGFKPGLGVAHNYEPAEDPTKQAEAKTHAETQEEELLPPETPSDWWDNYAHIKYKKQIPFYLLILLGRGVGLVEHDLPLSNGETLRIDRSNLPLMKKLMIDNPGCFRALDEAKPQSKLAAVNLMCSKIGVSRELAEIFIDGDLQKWMDESQMQRDMFPDEGEEGEEENAEDAEDAEEENLQEEGAGTICGLPEPRTDLSGEPYLVMMNLWDNYDHELVLQAFEEMDITEWPRLAQTMFLLKDCVDLKVAESSEA
jgi:hypothetical protein